TLLFYDVNGQRTPLRSHNGGFSAGDASFTADELCPAIRKTPEAVGPNALLRPVIQDSLLPTAAYIGGPAEIAYLAQSQVVYKTLLGRMPAILPRESFTLIEPPAPTAPILPAGNLPARGAPRRAHPRKVRACPARPF